MDESVALVEVTEHPAAVSVRASDDALLDRMRERSPTLDADLVSEHEPFFWRAEISSSRLDSHHTHMDKSSLRNYAADAEAGVPFMNSHRTGGLFKGNAELPLGRSLEGKYNAGQRSGEPHVEATFYTLRGLRLNEVSTDDFIIGVRSGIIHDVSIGFSGGRLVCDICNEDMMRSDSCMHFPGLPYEKEVTKDGKKRTEEVIATAAVVDARLAEVSAVFKGSTPGAMITIAKRMAEQRAFTPQAIAFIEDRYRIFLPNAARSFTAGMNSYTTSSATTVPTPAKEVEMTRTEERTEDAALATAQRELDGLRSALGLKAGDDALKIVQENRERLQTAEAEVARLKPLAADGEEYRKALVAEAMTEGKRAFGEHFNEEHYKSILASAPLDGVRSMRDNFREVADKLFPKQRVSVDSDDDSAEDRPERRQRRRTYVP